MVRIVQFSDTHFSNTYHFDEAAFKRGMDLMRTLPRDVVVHVGDVTEHGFEHEYQRARTELGDIDNLLCTPGNHDSRNVGYTLFEKYFGTPQQVFVNDTLACATFDSTTPDRNEGRIGKTDIKGIRRFLDDYSDYFTVVAFHHHLLPVPRSGRERGLLTDAGNVLKVILDYRADLVLSAHRHAFNVCGIEDTMVVNSGTFSSFKTRAGDAPSFNYIYTKDGHVYVSRYDIGYETPHTEVRRRHYSTLVPAADRKFRIVQLSDTHFGATSDFRSEVYDAAVKKVGALDPDIVVHAGDVTHDGLTESFITAREQLDRLPCPQLVVPGSNDYLHLGSELFYDFFESDNMTIGDVHFIWADSAKHDEQEGYIGRRQLKRIEQQIDPERMNVVVFHHHIVPVPYTRERHVIEDAGDVLKHLSGRVHLILNGSRHVSFSSIIDGTVISNSNTLSSRRVHGRYGNTFNVIDVLQNNSIVISEVGASSGVHRVLGVYVPLLSCPHETRPLDEVRAVSE
jgi:3',5'-cyclic AMP phosphodiesterase CpdA